MVHSRKLLGNLCRCLCHRRSFPVVVNLDLPNVEPNPEHVQWIDDIHLPQKMGNSS